LYTKIARIIRIILQFTLTKEAVANRNASALAYFFASKKVIRFATAESNLPSY